MYFVISVVMRKRNAKLRKLSPDLLNGIRFLIRIGITIISVMIFVVFLEIPADSVLLVLGIFTTAIMFASVKTVNNFIAGVWITFTKPFTIGDYVKIEKVEGIVVEISLNYTKIKHKSNNITQIPNLECLKSKIINYTIDLDYYSQKIERLHELVDSYDTDDKIHKDLINELHELEAIQKEYESVQKGMNNRKKKIIIEKSSKYVQKNKLVRYTFNLALPKEPRLNAEHLDELCEKYQDKFKITPDWKVIGLRYKIDYMFVIITPNPEDIIEFYDDFVWDIYKMMNVD
jgi:small-conductance mechanosensitive channel